MVAVHADQQIHDLVPAFGIQIAGRFVGQQHLGIGDDGARDGDTLLLAAGKFGGGVMFPAVQSDRFERRLCQCMARLRRFAAVEQGQFDVLLRRGARQQIESLKHEAKIMPAQQRALVAREILHMHAVEQIGARGRCVETAEDVHRG